MIVLNGGSSSGTTSIARALQQLLPQPWLVLGVDDLVDALPPALVSYGPQGEVELGEGFRALEDAWTAGLAAMARAGARIIVDDVFLGGSASQERTRAHLVGVTVVWAGVRCDPQIAATRESARGDRVVGMAASQAELVHRGVHYDVVVDTTRTSALDCARVIAARVV
ncbi:chloramphenicol phosphotransferase [Modestobacter sp. I12A-02628]|uniref:Chloramphenicol phosphotransferase n=1 Tax=Goekera deserti TaxID=2497753 RepID=A0A7K3WL70_9ACTN|nr:chloramphenicol phosphotransferase [Goekera deserti]NDI47027.1 chloramphenicol phosphotransferase [Goekera deserti]NEL56263.1 chloramphenicol phosphotransferase [Goekera deserti]